MKKLILLLTLCSLSFTAKEVVGELTYEQTQDIEIAKKIKNGKKYNSYRSQNGTIISIGDILIVGSPSTDETQFKQYQGNKKVFTYIMEGGVGMAAMSGITYLNANSQGAELVVQKIYPTHTKFSKKSPVYISITTIDNKLPKLIWKRTIMDIDKALNFGEIISPNAPLTRDAAIKKLKEAKDLLDLEMMTQEEYDALKNELSPIIRGK